MRLNLVSSCHHRLFFIAVFHHNPSFFVFGPNIIAGHKTRPKQVALNDSCGSVSLLIPTVNTWTTHKTIQPLVLLGHNSKRTHAFSESGRASVTVHPWMDHLYHTNICQTQSLC